MASENVKAGTIKGHGVKLGDTFNFHGLASDPIPTVEGTRVKFAGKVGTKYMIVTVVGEIMTWEFGPSAKIYADTTVSHHVTTEARTLNNGDTVFVGVCEHGWMTGFHLTEADARDVATGHGEVSRPLYVAPVVESPAVGDVVVTSSDIVGMVDKIHASGMVSVFGIVECTKIGDFYPIALTVITEDMTKIAQDTIKQNDRVFTAEAANFSVPASTWSVLVAHGWASLVDDGDMSRWVRTCRTADRIKITDGLPVWDYNLDAGRVILSTLDGDGWFNVETINGARSLMNGERVTTVHPYTGQTARKAVTASEAKAVDTARAEHDSAMSAWAEPLVKALAVPAPQVEIEASDGTVTTGADVEARFAVGFGEAKKLGKVWTSSGRLVDDIPTEAEVWAGTGTVVTYPISRPVRTNLNKRKRKATKVNARRVRGGF